eukprot:718867-Pyramimonas_sp.AAC.1
MRITSLMYAGKGIRLREPTGSRDAAIQVVPAFSAREYFGTDLDSSVVERLNTGLMSVLSKLSANN